MRDGSPALALGDGARLTLTGATVRAADVVLGEGPLGLPSTLRVAGGSLVTTGAVRVGDTGRGVLESLVTSTPRTVRVAMPGSSGWTVPRTMGTASATPGTPASVPAISSAIGPCALLTCKLARPAKPSTRRWNDTTVARFTTRTAPSVATPSLRFASGAS